MLSRLFPCYRRWTVSREVKTVFFNKTGYRFVETGNLPVIGLRDVMCHMAESPGKEGLEPGETQLGNHYDDDGLRSA